MSKNNKRIELEILEASHLEHFKFAKDIALIFPLKHPKRKCIEKELNNLSKQINKLKSK